MMDDRNVRVDLDRPICILGTGAAGLITAHVLLQDGFTNVTLITRDKTVGGTWARQRVHEGLFINNVHGEYRFSPLDMEPPAESLESGGRLSGADLCRYLERFYEKFLVRRVQTLFETEVLNIESSKTGSWSVGVVAVASGQTSSLTFSKLVLASGGCSTPYIPQALSAAAALNAGYDGLIIHSSKFVSQYDHILASTKPSEGIETKNDTILVVGGGNSARDISEKLANAGRNVVNVYDRGDAFLAARSPLPSFVRKSRFLSVLSGYKALRTRLERFLHTTKIGSLITHFIWSQIEKNSFAAYGIPQESPLRRTHPLFWTIRTSDNGKARSNAFFSLANAGVIRIISPGRVIGYKDGKVLLDNGVTLAPKAVLLATGYKSSWESIFKPEVRTAIGLGKHAPKSNRDVDATWDYESLRSAASANKIEDDSWVTSIYRGIVPAQHIMARDFAIVGSLFTSNFGYMSEVSAHWISSYFRGDRMRLPSSVEEAIQQAEEAALWMKRRFPGVNSGYNESYSGSYDLWSWPQAADELLEDMYLPSGRSGGNWLTWPFKVISSAEIANLTKEREWNRRI